MLQIDPLFQKFCGDGALYCNPYSYKDIEQKIQEVLTNSKLQEDMIKRGLEIAREFSWQKSAKEHLKVFKEVLNENSYSS